MSPMALIGAGWIVTHLGVYGFLFPLLATVSWPFALALLVSPLGPIMAAYGVNQIRWRSDRFTAAFWCAAVSIGLTVPLVGGAGLGWPHYWALSLAQLAFGYTLCSGILAGLRTSSPESPTAAAHVATRVTRLRLALAAAIGGTLVVDALIRLGAPVPIAVAALVVFLLVGVTIWFAVVLIQLRDDPQLQAGR